MTPKKNIYSEKEAYLEEAGVRDHTVLENKEDVRKGLKEIIKNVKNQITQRTQ